MTDNKIKKKNISGGSAAAGGMNFQAAVTAIAQIHMANGSKVGWLAGILDDIPVEVSSETGGSGDDIKLIYKDDSVAEVQVKKGLKQGENLWKPLCDMACAIHKKEVTYGILVVCPNSSNSIRTDLARDIHRIGEDRTDALKEISEKFVSKLKGLNLNPEAVCQNLRIVTVHALESDSANITAARSELRHLCEQNQVENAWSCLYNDASKLIEYRGRRTIPTIMQILRSSGILVKSIEDSKSPLSILTKLCDWTMAANASFEILGVKNPIPLDKAWLPLQTIVKKDDNEEQDGIAEALERYHSWENRRYESDTKSIEPTSIGRFIKHCVVIAGPGMGKSTLLKKLASVYASEGFPVLKVSLRSVALRMEKGSSFEESVFSLGLDGAAIGIADISKLGVHEWVILCDGLDECGSRQKLICEGLNNFIAGNSQYRVIVTTRPVGYQSSRLSGWRHYELLPLIEDKAENHIYKLLSGMCASNTNELAKYVEFAQAELKNNEVSKIVARSPLLLGLAAALTIQKVSFGQSKVDLYKKIFLLIDDTSSHRIDKLNVSKVKAKRFIDVLGWILFKHPVSLREEALNKCAEIIAPELGVTGLSANIECENLVQYWEDVGLVESIHHSGEDTITFIHKTFGEYAAARYLVAMPVDKQHDMIVSELSSNPSSEVLKFAASFGAINLITAEVVQRAKGNIDKKDWVSRALRFYATSEIEAEDEDFNTILDSAFSIIDSTRYFQSRSISISMLPISTLYPEEVAKRAKALLRSEYSWVRLSAWAFVTNGGEDFYEFTDLVAAFKSLPEMSEPGFSSSLSGGLSLNKESFTDLRESFVVNAIHAVVKRLGKEEADTVLSTLGQDELRKTVGFSRRINELLNSYGKSDLAKKVLGSVGGSLLSFNNDKEYVSAYNKAHKIILSALTGKEQLLADSSKIPHYIQLAAFFDASFYWNTSARDIWSWQEGSDEEIVREVFRGVVEIASLDKALLSSEAHFKLANVGSCKGEESLYWALSDIEHVDVEPDWLMVNNIDLDFQKLERALHHESDWIVQLATNLLGHVEDKELIRKIVSRVFKTGNGVSLWAVAQIAKEINMDLKQLVTERLKLPLVHGCQYLYQELSDLDIKLDDELKVILSNGLMKSGPLTAENATKVITKLSYDERKGLVPLMSEAFDYWLIHEEQTPEGGGRVPDSPREELLTILVAVGSVNDEELLNHITDVRSDVGNVAEKELVKRLGSNNKLRDEFIVGVRGGGIAPHLLRQSFRESIGFSAPQCEEIQALLSHENPNVRFAAMNVLDAAYLSQSQIEKWVKELKNDKELEIREKALSLLDNVYST